MKTAAEMTEKQRRAVEAMEGARNEGSSLNDYAKAHGLVIREVGGSCSSTTIPLAKRCRSGCWRVFGASCSDDCEPYEAVAESQQLVHAGCFDRVRVRAELSAPIVTKFHA